MVRSGVVIAALVISMPLANAASRVVTLTFHIPGQAPIAHSAPWFRGETVESAMQHAGVAYVTGWSPGLGDALLIAEGTPDSTSGGLGKPFWWLCINGKDPHKGMTSARIPSARSKVEWFWTMDAPCQ